MRHVGGAVVPEWATAGEAVQAILTSGTSTFGAERLSGSQTASEA